MIRFTDLLKENPDTIFYKKRTYNYVSDSNKCAFLVYKDLKSGKDSTLGYSGDKKEFYCDDDEVLKEIDELKIKKLPDDDRSSTEYWAKRAIERYRVKTNGGGHLELENILEGLGRFSGEPKLKGRVFLVDEPTGATSINPNLDIVIESSVPSGKSVIVTFWTYLRTDIYPYKDKYNKVLEFIGYKPEDCLYEPGSNFYTYEQFYDTGFDASDEKRTSSYTPFKYVPTVAKTEPHKSEAEKFFKVGDKVKVKGMKTGGDVLSIDGNNVTIKVTSTDVQGVDIGSEKTFSYAFLEPDTSNKGVSLDKVIDDKTQEFVDKRGRLHTAGAKFTAAEKANLEREVDSLEIELKVLNDLLNNGVKEYTNNVIDVVSRVVARKLNAKEKEKVDRYSLAAQAEKQYGMPIAKIRQKFRGVPLDKLVKKESLFKKLIKNLLG